MFTSISKKIIAKIPEELKVIWRQIENKRLFYFGAAASVLSAGITAVIPYIYGRLTDLATSDIFQAKIILLFLLFWLFLSLLNTFIRRLANKSADVLAIYASGDFFRRLISHWIDLPLDFHKEKKFGVVWYWINDAGSAIYNFIEGTAFNILPRFISLLIALFIIFLIEWRLASVIVLTIACYVFITLKYTLVMIREDKAQKRLWDKSYGDASDGVENIISVKSFTNEKFETKKNKRNFKRAINGYLNFLKYWLGMETWQQVIFDVGFVIIFGIGFFLLADRQLTVGKFIMFIGYFNLVTNPILNLSMQYRSIRRYFISINRGLKLLKQKPEADYPHAKDIGKIRGKVIFQNVSFKYKKGGEILKDVNFSVEPGEMAALVGESGVGKSTLASLISRYYLTNKGKIFVDGKEIKKIKIASLRKQIAFVPQEVALFNDTVKNNIAYGKIGASDEEITAAAKAANADEFIEKFAKKYDTLVGERGVKLSTGQKQRIAIARAILRDPRILILDEATAALDSVSEKLVQDALRNLIKGRTVFVIAHRLSTIVHADKIIVLEGGKIVETGRHEELIKQEGVYKKFWELQTRVEEAKPAHLLNGIIEER